MPTPTHENQPEQPSRRSFLRYAGAVALAATGCGDKAAQTASTSANFESPVDDSFQFLSHKLENGKPLMNKGEPVINPDIRNFKDVATFLNGQPFTFSVMTALCTAPVEGRDMLCDKMGKALAATAKSNPAMKHVVLSALSGGDYTGGTLWGSLSDKGLTPDNTIVLFPTENGKASGLPMDGKLVAKIQNSLHLPNDSATDYSAHNAAISYYSGTGKLCATRLWRDVINHPSMPEECRSR